VSDNAGEQRYVISIALAGRDAPIKWFASIASRVPQSHDAATAVVCAVSYVESAECSWAYRAPRPVRRLGELEERRHLPFLLQEAHLVDNLAIVRNVRHRSLHHFFQPYAMPVPVWFVVPRTSRSSWGRDQYCRHINTGEKARSTRPAGRRGVGRSHHGSEQAVGSQRSGPVPPSAPTRAGTGLDLAAGPTAPTGPGSRSSSALWPRFPSPPRT